MTDVSAGQNVCGASTDILSLESCFPKPRGYRRNPTGLLSATSYEIVTGQTIPVSLSNPSQDLIGRLVAAGQRLGRSGVKAITRLCGLLTFFQTKFVVSVNAPFFVSSSIQAVTIHLTAVRPICLLIPSADLPTPHHLSSVGAEKSAIGTKDMPDGTVFDIMVLPMGIDHPVLGQPFSGFINSGIERGSLA